VQNAVTVSSIVDIADEERFLWHSLDISEGHGSRLLIED
jgi:hypothetical protein